MAFQRLRTGLLRAVAHQLAALSHWLQDRSEPSQRAESPVVAEPAPKPADAPAHWLADIEQLKQDPEAFAFTEFAAPNPDPTVAATTVAADTVIAVEEAVYQAPSAGEANPQKTFRGNEVGDASAPRTLDHEETVGKPDRFIPQIEPYQAHKDRAEPQQNQDRKATSTAENFAPTAPPAGRETMHVQPLPTSQATDEHATTVVSNVASNVASAVARNESLPRALPLRGKLQMATWGGKSTNLQEQRATDGEPTSFLHGEAQVVNPLSSPQPIGRTAARQEAAAVPPDSTGIRGGQELFGRLDTGSQSTVLHAPIQQASSWVTQPLPVSSNQTEREWLETERASSLTGSSSVEVDLETDNHQNDLANHVKIQHDTFAGQARWPTLPDEVDEEAPAMQTRAQNELDSATIERLRNRRRRLDREQRGEFWNESLF